MAFSAPETLIFALFFMHSCPFVTTFSRFMKKIFRHKALLFITNRSEILLFLKKIFVGMEKGCTFAPVFDKTRTREI